MAFGSESSIVNKNQPREAIEEASNIKSSLKKEFGNGNFMLREAVMACRSAFRILQANKQSRLSAEAQARAVSGMRGRRLK